MMPALDNAFSDVMYELEQLRGLQLDLPGLQLRVRDVDRALARACDELEGKRRDPLVLRSAYMAVLALGQMLDGAGSHDPRVMHALDLTRTALDELLDTLEPYVSEADRAVRSVLLCGEPLAAALARLFSA